MNNRQEQIEQARRLIATGISEELVEVLRQQFPELKESEDEKIRQALIRFFKHTHNWANLKYDGDEIVAYLERQKELAVIPDELVKNYKLFCEQGGRELALLINAINGFNKQKGQQPAEWSEEDKGILLSIKCVIDEVWHSKDTPFGYSKEELEEMWNWLDVAWQRLEYPKENKEWNEGTKKALDEISDYLKYKGREEDADFIRHLHPQPQHGQEEVVLPWESGHPEPYKSVLILRHGNVVVEGEWNEKMGMWYQYGFQCHLKDNEVEGWMDKKSLLSGNFNPQPHWKPSEEQMKSLSTAYRLGKLGKTDMEVLQSLHNDLKSYNHEIH